jgi:DNA-binding PadR family transcriptional regulator
MPTKVKEVRDRLEKCFREFNFLPRDRDNIAKILAKTAGGITPMKWASQCIKSTRMNKAGMCVSVSPQYFYAVRSLAESEKWIEVVQTGKRQKMVRLTDRGKEMIERLRWPATDRIEFTVDRGSKPGKISITLESEEIRNDVVRLRKLLLPFLRNFTLREFVGQNLGEILLESREVNCEFKISYEKIHEDRDVVWLIRRMLRFYADVCKVPEEESRRFFPACFITPHMFDDPRRGHWSWNYYNYWDKRRCEVLENWGDRGRLVEKYVPKWLIEAIKRPVVRGWIERRLDENPNFFMPYIFWEGLGFEEVIEKKDREEPLESYPKWSHPYDTLLTYPKFGEFLPEMDLLFTSARFFYERDDIRGAATDIYGGIRDHWEKPGFYEAWVLLREVRGLRGLDIFKPIDRAFIREISGTPVNLADVYGDLKDGKRSISEVVEAIERGDYDQRRPTRIRKTHVHNT